MNKNTEATYLDIMVSYIERCLKHADEEIEVARKMLPILVKRIETLKENNENEGE